MRSARMRFVSAAVCGLAVFACLPAETVTLAPSKDNTLYESPFGSLSNGAGQHFFAGTSGNGMIRRGLLAFDLSSIPSEATVTSVRLTLSMSRTSEITPLEISLHRLLKDWGEGASQADRGEGEGASAVPPDATWLHNTFPNSFWVAEGGDFAPASSATAAVGDLGRYTWQSTPQMVADVQAWIDNPSSNFGWALLGLENRARTAKRFDSRQNEVPANRPRLDVDFSLLPAAQPGTIQFTSDAFRAGESSGSAVITVSRSGGSDGQVSVEYAAGSGTAEAGDDFEAVSGMLVFEDGQSGEMSFEIPIADDDRFEGDETIELALSNPSGGVVLGTPSNAEVVISDEDDLVNPLYFAQFGNGLGLFSQITLINRDSESANARIVLRGNDGQPLLVDLDGMPLPEGVLDISLPPSGLRALETDGLGELAVGAVTVLSDRPLAGVILFGGPSGLTGVADSPESQGFRIPVETNAELGVNTGIAVQNLEEVPVNLTLELLDPDGDLLATAQSGPETELPAQGHSSRFVNEFSWAPEVDFSLFRGILQVVPTTGSPPSPARVSATALQTRPNQLATLPIVQ